MFLSLFTGLTHTSDNIASRSSQLQIPLQNVTLISLIKPQPMIHNVAAAPPLHCAEATNCAEPLADHLIDYTARALHYHPISITRYTMYPTHRWFYTNAIRFFTCKAAMYAI